MVWKEGGAVVKYGGADGKTSSSRGSYGCVRLIFQ
jgi:hypothetical protein